MKRLKPTTTQVIKFFAGYIAAAFWFSAFVAPFVNELYAGKFSAEHLFYQVLAALFFMVATSGFFPEDKNS